MDTNEELMQDGQCKMDGDSNSNICFIYQTSTHFLNITSMHIQKLLLKIVSGDHKTDLICKYIRCPNFRAVMKAKSSGNLPEVFHTQQVTDLNNLYNFSIPVFVSLCADAAVVGINGGFCFGYKNKIISSTNPAFEQQCILFGFVLDIPTYFQKCVFNSSAI